MRERRRAGRAERGVEHEQRLQPRDAVDGEAPAALEVLDELLQFGIELVADLAPMTGMPESCSSPWRSQRTSSPRMPARSGRWPLACGRHSTRNSPNQ